MRKLTHKTHKIVPCKWNNWHNVSIKEYLTTALTPDLSVIFALLIVAKSIFYYCVPTCYLSPCSVCWQCDTSGAQCSYLCRGGQMSADRDMFHPSPSTLCYHASCGHNHYHAPLYSCLAPTRSISDIYIIITQQPVIVVSFWFYVRIMLRALIPFLWQIP